MRASFAPACIGGFVMRRPRIAGALSRVFRRGSAVIVLLCAGSGCDDTQSPTVNATSAIDARWRGGVLEFGIASSSTGSGTLVLVAQSFEFDPTSEILRAEVALHNTSTVAVPGPGSVAVFGFIPADVTPLDAMCSSGECAFDHRGTYGDDGVLSAGETSTPVLWRLHVPGGMSFAFRARFAVAVAGPGTIAGIVFDDRDHD